MTSSRPGPERGATAPSSSPVDWGLAERIARRVAQRSAARAEVVDAEMLAPMAALAEQRIESATGLRSASGPARIEVIDREAWIALNVASFRALLTPLVDTWAARRQRGGHRTRASMVAATRRVTAAELGAVLGWMSTRVLGQYDVLLGDGDGDGAGVHLVGPNIVALETRYGFEPDQFRLWIATHELTHRAQFTGVPWMRDHFLELVHASLRLAAQEPADVVAALRQAMRDRGELRRRLADGGVGAVVATPEQRAVLDRIGGLMSLLEGHGDVVMDRAVADLVPSAERFSHVLRVRRAHANPLARLLMRLTGVEAKLAQYLAGERFIAAIEAAAGTRAIDVCWQTPDNLPTLEEVRSPDRWLERVGGAIVPSR